MERMGQVEERAFAMDPIATQSYISDARQMVTEFRQARVLFPKERVSRPSQSRNCTSRLKASLSIAGDKIHGCIASHETRSIRLPRNDRS